MQFDGFTVEKWRAQFTGAIEIEEREGLAMRTDKVVVMVVATRIRKSIPEPLDEDGTMRITRQNRIEHLAVLEGDLREQALTLLATGSERGFQGTLLAGLESDADPETGEVRSGMASYADPGTPVAPPPLTPADMHVAEGASWDGSVHTPPEPAVVISDEDIDIEDVDLDHPSFHPNETDGNGDYEDDIEFFDVPPVRDDSQPIGTGPIKKPGARSGNGSSGGDGPKVAPVDYADLASVGASSGRDPAAAPVGEIIGPIRAPRKDKDLEDFFNEEINPG